MKKIIGNILLGVAILTPSLSVAQTVSTSTGDVGTTAGGTVKVQDSNGDLDLFGDTGGNFYLRSNGGEFRFRPNGATSNHFSLNTSSAYFRGKLGVGTTTPEGNLQLHGDSQRMIFSTSTSGNPSSARIEFWENTGGISSSENAHFAIQYDGQSDRLRFKGKNNTILDQDYLSILRSGRIGIGTIEPSEELEVRSSGFGEIMVSSNVNTNGSGIGRIGFEGKTNSGSEIKFAGLKSAIKSSDEANPIGELNFETRDGSGNYNTRMTLSGSKLGIGTSTPNGNLELFGSNQRLIISTEDSNEESTARIEFWENLSGIANPDNAHFAIQYDGFNDGLRFKGKNDSSLDEDFMFIKRNGQVGIGTETMSTHKLAVNGTIGSREIKVEMDNWEDRVFRKDYNLNTLEEVESFISENQHLPNIPSEEEVLENGIYLGDMNAKLLRKIEELTLYMIDLNKQVQSQQDEISELKELNSKLIEQLKN